MPHRGFSHIGLSSLDLDKTRVFYEDVVGFEPVVADAIYFKGPNGITLEYCCLIREFTDDDATMQERSIAPRAALNLAEAGSEFDERANRENGRLRQLDRA